MNTCLDEGLLQAYMDGELAGAQMEAAATHIASCATCAELAHEAEHEYAFMASAFAPVMNVPAPTERLRARLEDAIADLQAPPRRVTETNATRLRARLVAFASSFTFTPRQIGAFASFLLAVALTVTLTMLRPQPQSDDQVAQGGQVAQPTAPPAPAVVQPTTTTQDVAPKNDNKIVNVGGLNNKPVQFVKAKYEPRTVRPSANVARGEQLTPSQTDVALLPDEKNYMTTIATLDAAD